MIENDADDRYLTKEMFLSQGFDAEVDFIDSNALLRPGSSFPLWCSAIPQGRKMYRKAIPVAPTAT
jgi:hypothetical protein